MTSEDQIIYVHFFNHVTLLFFLPHTVFLSQLMEKDESLRKYEQQLKTLNESNITLQETLKKQGPGDRKWPQEAVLEEEWMRRFSETREMYEEAIQGYKDQLEQTQRKLVVYEQDHAQQVEELREQLEKAQSELRVKEKDVLEEKKVVDDEQNHAREGETQRDLLEGNRNDVRAKGSPGHHVHKPSGNSSPKDMAGIAGEGSPKGSREDAGSSTHPQTAITDEGKPDSVTATRTDKMYGEALELIVRRLENLQVGGEEVESMIGVIKGTISTCLQEWRDSFNQARVQQDGDRNQLQMENEELQRKLRGRNKKIETLQKQTHDMQQQNEKLLHQCSLLESRVSVTFQPGHSGQWRARGNLCLYLQCCIKL